MFKPYYIVFYLSITFLFFSCSKSLKNEIITLENEKEQCKVVEFISLSQPKPFYCSDSLLLLKQEYDSLYGLKLKELARHSILAKEDYKNAKLEFETIENAQLKKAYGMGVKSLEYKYNQIVKVDSMYKKHPEQTQFGKMLSKMDYYSKNKGLKLGNVVTVVFTGTQGYLDTLTYKKHYFKNKKQLVVFN